MRARRAWMPALLGLVALLSWAPALEAQAPARDRQADRERLEALVRIRMAEMIRDRLGLSGEESARLEAVVESLMEERRELRRQERILRSRIASLTGEGADPGDAEARRVLEEMVRLREAEVALFRREQERLLEVLTPAQVVTFHALRERMSQRLRELRGGRGPRGPGGPGGPGGMGGSVFF